MVCIGSLGLAIPLPTKGCKNSKWNEDLFFLLLCYTETNGTKTKSTWGVLGSLGQTENTLFGHTLQSASLL